MLRRPLTPHAKNLLHVTPHQVLNVSTPLTPEMRGGDFWVASSEVEGDRLRATVLFSPACVELGVQEVVQRTAGPPDAPGQAQVVLLEE